MYWHPIKKDAWETTEIIAFKEKANRANDSTKGKRQDLDLQMRHLQKKEAKCDA